MSNPARVPANRPKTAPNPECRTCKGRGRVRYRIVGWVDCSCHSVAYAGGKIDLGQVWGVYANQKLRAENMLICQNCLNTVYEGAMAGDFCRVCGGVLESK